MNAEHAGNAGEHVNVESHGAMIQRRFGPAVIGRARRIALTVGATPTERQLSHGGKKSTFL